jgi:hypothetical protein
LHGGRLHCEPGSGGLGACFVIELPRQGADGRAVGAPARSPA